MLESWKSKRGPTQQTRCSRKASTSVCEGRRIRHRRIVSSGCRLGLRILGLDLCRRIRRLWVLPAHDYCQ